MKNKIYQLCYVEDNKLYFTSQFNKVCGDDWDDRPYEYNAGPPYEEFDIVEYIIPDCLNQYIKYPCDGYTNSPYSVESINHGGGAWVTIEIDNIGTQLHAGIDYDTAKKRIEVMLNHLLNKIEEEIKKE